MRQAGIVILVLGLVLTIFTSFNFSTRENVVSVGDVKITKDEPHSMNWSPVAGIAVMGIGAVLLWRSGKK